MRTSSLQYRTWQNFYYTFYYWSFCNLPNYKFAWGCSLLSLTAYLILISHTIQILKWFFLFILCKGMNMRNLFSYWTFGLFRFALKCCLQTLTCGKYCTVNHSNVTNSFSLLGEEVMILIQPAFNLQFGE